MPTMAEELFEIASTLQIRLIDKEEADLISMAIIRAEEGKLNAEKEIAEEINYSFKEVLMQRLRTNGFETGCSDKRMMTISWDFTVKEGKITPAKRVTTKE